MSSLREIKDKNHMYSGAAETNTTNEKKRGDTSLLVSGCAATGHLQVHVSFSTW